MEALNIMEDSILQDMCTCARNLGCNSAQDCYVYLCNGLCWTFLINLFCYILSKFVWIFCVVQVEGAAQWPGRIGTFFTFAAIAVNLLETAFLNFCKKKGNYKYFNSSQTFCSYIKYRLSRKLFFGPVPILPRLKNVGEDWDSLWGGMGHVW